MYYPDKLTDEELKKLEKRIRREYGRAVKDLDKIIHEYWYGKKYVNSKGETVKCKSLADRDTAFRKLVDSGEKKESDYMQWQLNQIGRGERFEALRYKLALRVTQANKTAVSYINDSVPGIYSLNRNYEAYRINKAGAVNADFILFDESTVRRLITKNPKLMPYYPKKKALKRGIDLAYGQEQITKYITSGIMRGASVHQIAQDLMDNLSDRSYAAAVRWARTAATGAQNAGRLDSYFEAETMGIHMKKRWVATLDNRTRHSHAMLDGETVDIEEAFSNGLMHPGDPNGAAEEVYNCRCTMITEIEGIERSAERRAKTDDGDLEIIPDMTYQEWLEWKKNGN